MTRRHNEWLPEVQAYYEQMITAENLYSDARRAARRNTPTISDASTEEERQTYYAALQEKRNAEVEAEKVYREARSAAYANLANSDNPIVKWLATNEEIRRDYWGHAEVVLKSLPLSREEIDTFGENQGWCSDYNYLLAEAEKAGVLPAPLPELADITPMVQELMNWYGGSDSHERMFRRMLSKHVPALLESAKAKAKEQEKAAESTDTSADKSAPADTTLPRTAVAA